MAMEYHHNDDRIELTHEQQELVVGGLTPEQASRETFENFPNPGAVLGYLDQYLPRLSRFEGRELDRAGAYDLIGGLRGLQPALFLIGLRRQEIEALDNEQVLNILNYVDFAVRRNHHAPHDDNELEPETVIDRDRLLQFLEIVTDDNLTLVQRNALGHGLTDDQARDPQLTDQVLDAITIISRVFPRMDSNSIFNSVMDANPTSLLNLHERLLGKVSELNEQDGRLVAQQELRVLFPDLPADAQQIIGDSDLTGDAA